MPTTYPGNPTAAESPSPQPMPGEIPQVVLPVGSDVRNAATVQQLAKTPADYLAFLMSPGRMKVYQENYPVLLGTISVFQIPITAYPQLCVGINGTSHVDFDTADIGTTPGYSGRLARLVPGTTSGYYVNVFTTKSAYSANCPGMQLSFEQDVAIASSIAVGDYRFGLTDLTSALSHFVGLRHLHTDTNWILVTELGTFTVPGSMPTAGTIQRFKVIYSGAATPAGVANGNTALVRVYLDDVLVLTQSGAFYSFTGQTFAFDDARSTGAGGGDSYWGGMTLSWNAY